MKIIKNLKKSAKKILKIQKKFLILGIIIIFLLINFVASGNNNKISPQFAEVKKQDLKQEISASGIVTGKNSVILRFKSGGKLAYANVKTGDIVAKGDVIAGLDTQDLVIALRIAQSNFRDKTAIVDKIHDDLKDVTAESYTQRQTRTTAEVAHDNAYDSLLAAQRDFQDAVIIAPIAGVVTSEVPIPGQIVSASDTIAQIVDFSQIIFEADIDEADISKVSLGKNAEITLNAYGDKIFKGTVVEIIPQTHTTTSGSTVVSIKISIDDSNIAHVSGLNGQVNVITSEKDNVLSVPVDAVRNNNTVFVKTESGIRTKEVSTGFKTDTDVEITKGLKEGEQVVVNQSDAIKGTSGVFRLPFLRLGGGGFRSVSR